MVFTFDVCQTTHDDLQNGVLCVAHRIVTVQADSFADADLAAAQIVACHGMVTRTQVRI